MPLFCILLISDCVPNTCATIVVGFFAGLELVGQIDESMSCDPTGRGAAIFHASDRTITAARAGDWKRFRASLTEFEDFPIEYVSHILSRIWRTSRWIVWVIVICMVPIDPNPFVYVIFQATVFTLMLAKSVLLLLVSHF